jgi:hypothetical protein
MKNPLNLFSNEDSANGCLEEDSSNDIDPSFMMNGKEKYHNNDASHCSNHYFESISDRNGGLIENSIWEP